VLANWHSVLRAIHLASSKLAKTTEPKDAPSAEMTEAADVPLPQQLVRIPTEHAGLIPQSTSGNAAD